MSSLKSGETGAPQSGVAGGVEANEGASGEKVGQPAELGEPAPVDTDKMAEQVVPQASVEGDLSSNQVVGVCAEVSFQLPKSDEQSAQMGGQSGVLPAQASSENKIALAIRQVYIYFFVSVTWICVFS